MMMTPLFKIPLKMSDCLFCMIDKSRIIATNEMAYAIHDSFPVTFGHTLVIPKRHVENYFGLTQDELLACNSLLTMLSEKIQAQDSSVAGFNIGMNAGHAAGQTIFHCHIHLIPRLSGDVDDPTGGLRNIICNSRDLT
jgi:diadenosine tetraphosphate (Ap4A) HIT family hydrolase